MTTNKDLQDLANKARAAFDSLEKDGLQPPMRIAEAWKSMADKVIAANGGIAPEWLRTQAAIKGFEVAVDEAGKAITNTDKATSKAVSSMVTGLNRAREAADGLQEGMHGVERASGRAASAARSFEQGGPRNFVEERNAGVNGSQGIMHQNSGPLNLVPQFQSRKELEGWWQEWKNQYSKENPFAVKSSGALGNYQFDLTQFAVQEAGKSIDLQQAARNAVENPPEQTTPAKPTASVLPQTTAGARESAPAPAPAQPVMTHRHEVNLNGRSFAWGTDAQGSDATQQFMQELERSAQLRGV